MHVCADGPVLVNHRGTEMGQGLNNKVAQVVAHELMARVQLWSGGFALRLNGRA